jgi:murein hydrolase activator
VVTGEPDAVMGGGGRRAVLANPYYYVEFRKDGVSVDPGPWWAAK